MPKGDDGVMDNLDSRVEVLDRIDMIYRIGHQAEAGSGRRKCRGREVFGCIPHGRGAYAAAGNENYCGNLLWQSSLTLLPPQRNCSTSKQRRFYPYNPHKTIL